MSKLQSILGLLVFLVIIFSMDMIFGNPLRETFRGTSLKENNNVLMNYEKNRIKPRHVDVPLYHIEKSDDEPFFFNWFNTI